MALAFIALGIQSWRVVSAIVDAEKVAVVPLPTREAEIAFTIGEEKTPTSAAPTSQALTPTIAPTEAQSAATESAPTTNAEQESEAEPTSDDPTPSPTSVSQPSPSPTPTHQPAAQEESLSRLEVVREIVEASMANGDPGKSAVWDGRTDLYVLAIGVDRRPDGGDQNADVIILTHIDLVNHRVSAVSIPRDLLVEIPGVGVDKINSSYNHGYQARPDDPVAGVAKGRDTIEHVFRVPIDYYVLVDFDGFEAVVDAIGGIEVDVPYDIVDDQYPTEDYGVQTVEFKAGRQHMDGDTALKYVRTRHADSDDARRIRQLDVLLAIFEKGKSFHSITRADEIIMTVGASVQTNFTLEEQLTLARLGLQLDREDIRLSSLGEPLLQGGFAPDGRWVYTGDLDAIVAFVHEALDTSVTVTEP